MHFSGRISVDVTHAQSATESYYRLTIGRDYESVALVRGVWRTGEEESLAVEVHVEPVALNPRPPVAGLTP